jgi:hypothetical protein
MIRNIMTSSMAMRKTLQRMKTTTMMMRLRTVEIATRQQWLPFSITKGISNSLPCKGSQLRLSTCLIPRMLSMKRKSKSLRLTPTHLSKSRSSWLMFRRSISLLQSLKCSREATKTNLLPFSRQSKRLRHLPSTEPTRIYQRRTRRSHPLKEHKGSRLQGQRVKLQVLWGLNQLSLAQRPPKLASLSLQVLS